MNRSIKNKITILDKRGIALVLIFLESVSDYGYNILAWSIFRYLPMSKVNSDENFRITVKNRSARFNYELIETFEAGVILTGSEVKSIRDNKVSINEAFVGSMEGLDLFLFNADISPYKQASYNSHEPRRPRKLLLHKSQINKLLVAIQKKGLTIVPLTMYFNHKGILKINIALARGKNTIDKRETIKARDWNIQKNRILKHFNN